MGILNVTPDSFSDGGCFNQTDKALHHVEEMIEQGVDIIDVGGESTRPGYEKISVEEEIRRVTSTIEAIKKRYDIPISVDTYKAPVMQEALEAGADMANDIWGLKYDALYAPPGQSSLWDCGTMAEVVSHYQVPVCMMHNRKEPVYGDLLKDVLEDLRESVAIGKKAGIDETKMILDPGIGFAKSCQENLQILAHLEEFHKLGTPLLLAASRKSVIGLTLDLPVDQREEGTMVTSILAGINGWDFVRVHDVQKNVRALKMLQAILSMRGGV
jgi:dihydropteroate synthase